MGGSIRLWPLFLAAPLGVLFGYFDAQGDAREAAAELAGSMAFALLPATFATLAGWPLWAALGLAGVSVTRCVPTVLTVRAYIRRRKGKPVSSSVPLLVSLFCFGAIVTLASLREISWIIIGGTAVLLTRTVWLLSKRAPAWSAQRIGITEGILGLVYVAFVTLAYKYQ